MVTNCPVCKKRFVPIKVVVGLKSKCSHCKSSFRAVEQKNSLLAVLPFVIAAPIVKHSLKPYVNEDVTLILIAIIAFIFFTFITNIYEVNEPDS